MPPAYQVVFTKSASKEFENLPKKIQDRIVKSLKFLSTNPFSERLHIKKWVFAFPSG